MCFPLGIKKKALDDKVIISAVKSQQGEKLDCKSMNRVGATISWLRDTGQEGEDVHRHAYTQTHRWFHSYAAVWEGQAVVLHRLASAFLQGSGQQREAMDRCRVRLTLKKQPFPLLLLLPLLDHWALPREKEEGRGSKRQKKKQRQKI